ncbi:hypothetical protein [Halovivax cerinus]|uniref:Uncharacterized protein n=1 Tax=Halovivax cerinus TaxID=1487865 RepID=A0ABD5NRP3_9EURY|nr:hypothetical protein [Halovivax cerinus]
MVLQWTTLDAASDDPDAVYAAVSEAYADERVDVERAEPADPAPDRLRLDLTGATDTPLRSAIEAEAVGPLDWAVVLWQSDEMWGSMAWIYRGQEAIDTYRGSVSGSADTIAYLERFHGVRVSPCTPATPDSDYVPALDLATTEYPDDRLSLETPSSFAITGPNRWLSVIAETNDPDAFVDWLEAEFAERSLTLASPGDVIDAPWVTDGPTTLSQEPAAVESDTRVRVRVPYQGSLFEGELGVDLPVDHRRLETACRWAVVLRGDDDREQVSAWVYEPERLTFDAVDAIDRIDGDDGRRGVDVAAALERVHGIRIGPTPPGRDVTEATGDVTEAADRRPEGYEPKRRLPEVLGDLSLRIGETQGRVDGSIRRRTLQSLCDHLDRIGDSDAVRCLVSEDGIDVRSIRDGGSPALRVTVEAAAIEVASATDGPIVLELDRLLDALRAVPDADRVHADLDQSKRVGTLEAGGSSTRFELPWLTACEPVSSEVWSLDHGFAATVQLPGDAFRRALESARSDSVCRLRLHIEGSGTDRTVEFEIVQEEFESDDSNEAESTTVGAAHVVDYDPESSEMALIEPRVWTETLERVASLVPDGEPLTIRLGPAFPVELSYPLDTAAEGRVTVVLSPVLNL